MRHLTNSQHGVTLVELLFVVAIIGILAAIAVPAYKKWVSKSKASEVPFMLGLIQMKEVAYQAETGVYLQTGVDDNDIYPDIITYAPQGGGEATPLGSLPPAWRQLRIAPGRDSLYCGYVAITGPAGTQATAADASAMWSAAPTREWFYIRATCNWDSDLTTLNTWLVRGDRAVNTASQTNEGK